MRQIEIAQLYDSEYSVTVINVLKQHWRSAKSFDCNGRPKRYNLLLYIDGCKAEYTLKNGTTFSVSSGAVVYTPANSQYRVRFYDFESENSSTTGINFLLYDAENEPFVLSNKIEVFNTENANYKLMFNSISNFSEANVVCHGKVKSIMYDLIFKISEFYRKDHYNKYRIIEKGINYLEWEDDQSLKIADIAQMCNISEVYFRRLFREYSGMSPVKYRNEKRMQRAKNYLLHTTLSIGEIAHRLGFPDDSYFIKSFREKTGVTPSEYRKNLKEN